ncbi:MAG TPA: hypothetical protein VJL89_09250 [Thermodesulfovibrionia bacterium]|nr:hypothetical protein [Thermodesulfovibrionia bacterium]
MDDQDKPANPKIGDWIETTPLPKPIAASWSAGKRLIFHKGKVYIFGSSNAEDALLTNVYYSKINVNGSLGSWVETTPLPKKYSDQDVVKIGNYVYLITGANGSTDVYYASVKDDGSVGSWISTSPLQPSRQGFAVAEYGSYIYSVAGNAGGLKDFVKFTSVKPDGSLNTWQDTTPLPEPTQDTHTAVASNGYLYVLTHTGNSYYATINSNGALGQWTKTTPLPEVISRYSAFGFNGYLYNLGW